MDNFCNLHLHTEYSTLDGYGHPDEFIKRVKELGQTACAITDHASISGHFRFYQACIKEGIKPILGCEFYIVDNIQDSMSKRIREYNHITILAKNLEGYRNLLKLVSFAHNDGYYYKPKIDWHILKNYNKGLITTSSCPSGKLANMIKLGLAKEHLIRELNRQKSIFDDFFIELAPWQYNEGREIAKTLYKLAEETKIPMVLTMDCHYPLKEHAKIQEVMLCIQSNDRMSNPKRWKFDQTDFYLKSGTQMQEDWEKLYPNLPFKQEMIDNTKLISDMVDFKFPKAKPINFPFVGDKQILLRSMINKGMIDKKLTTKEYKDRVEREFKLIVDKQYVDYFLVIADLINWAKQQGIFIGPGRGSASGSLICYLVNITEINPIPYGLLFERFIDINRDDLPDVDIDIEDERRQEVKQYLKIKYGENQVVSLATFGTFRGRLCLQDIGRIFNINPEITAEVKKLVIQRSGGDSRFSNTVEDTFTDFETAANIIKEYPEFKYAKHLEGYIRSMGVHAAGTIVSNEPIENFAALYRSEGLDEKVISMDYHDASAVGLLKIDLLGLTTMSILKNAVNLIKKRHNQDINLYTLPTDDELTLKAFREGKLFGIFQFDGQAMMQICKQVKPETLEELSDINALSRPGPLHGGNTTSYILRKFGKEKITYLHPMLKAITKQTYGCILYQEQVMEIVRQLGKFSWEDTSTIRRTMSRSTGQEAFDKFRNQFIKGAKENGIEKELAIKIWKQVYTFGSWGMNKSHCISYAIIGYWMMWLKVHYPIEFYVSMVMKESQEPRIKKVLKEFQAEGFKLLPIEINQSKESFTIDQESIRIGFRQILGLGDKTAKKIVKYQPYTGYIDFIDKTKLNKTSNLLLQVGAFKNVGFDRLSPQLALFEPKDASKKTIEYANPSIEILARLCPVMNNTTPYKDWIEWCNKHVPVKVIPIKNISEIEERTNVAIIGSTDPGSLFNPKNKLEESKSRGIDIIKKEGEENFTVKDYDFLNFDIEDETDYITIRIGYKIYKKFHDMIWAAKPSDVLLVTGMVNGGIRMVFANDIVNLTEFKKNIIKKHLEIEKHDIA
jgi:DNA polymerase-3 subunit alpha